MEVSANEITKELDDIYGIEECKWEILNYVKYLKLDKKDNFANYNVIIHNRSSYPSETKLKLIDFLNKMLVANEVINTEYEFLTSAQLGEDVDKLNLEKDMIIINSRDFEKNLEENRNKIVAVMEKFPNKVFILIDESFSMGSANALFNQYYDWFFHIERISEDNKKSYAKKLLKTNDISVDSNCNYIDELIKESFFLVKSKINNTVLQCKINNTNLITDEFVKKYLETKQTENTKNEKDENKSNRSQNKEYLDSLIGINDVKEEINKIVNYVAFCKKKNKKMPMLHMCFMGNPGTGKTTVARIIGEIFKEREILSTGRFVEIHGRDLVGQYVGWTAREVQSQIRRAKGGVLFIDEAYSLNAEHRGSFEDEAIATLIKEMEDKRDDLCVVLAGYSNEMKELIQRNPGFESRIQFYLNFPDYNEDELYEIFKQMAKKEDYKLTNGAKTELYNNFKMAINTPNFSNGRYVRNLYEKIKIEQANRVEKEAQADENLIRKCDVEPFVVDVKQDTKVKIGFQM